MRQQAMTSLEDSDIASAQATLDTLTSAQLDVIERVARHMTSKEIARDLELHPRTVDQRVKAVISKLGATDRADAARRFIELCRICGRTIYDSSLLDVLPPDAQQIERELPQEPHFVLRDSQAWSPVGFAETEPKFLEVVDQRFGRLGRVTLIVCFAIALAILALTVAAVGTTLNQLV